MKTKINGVIIELTPEQVQQVLAAHKPIKTKEERFKELIEGIDINKPVIDFEKYSNSFFWFKENNCYFEYNWKTDYFWINSNLIWSVFEKEYKMKYTEIQNFMRVQGEEHFKLKRVTPQLQAVRGWYQWNEHFKLK